MSDKKNFFETFEELNKFLVDELDEFEMSESSKKYIDRVIFFIHFS